MDHIERMDCSIFFLIMNISDGIINGAWGKKTIEGFFFQSEKMDSRESLNFFA